MQTQIFQQIAETIARRELAWVVTVIAADGSTPAKPGMKQLIGLTGSIAGTTGGGEVEKRVIERVIAEKPQQPVLWKYDLGMGANSAEKTKMICGGIQEFFVEPLQSGVPLYIFGGGHCGIELSQLAAQVGFRVTVIDNRSEWANAEKHPQAFATMVVDYEKLPPLPDAPEETFIAIMTSGHAFDETVLRQLLDVDWRYLGMLGSAQKVQAVWHRMEKSGIERKRLDRVYAPIGLPIDSHTPHEIAISILAQMIAVRNGVTQISLR